MSKTAVPPSARKAPSYRRHSSGQAVVTLQDGPGGRRKDFLLGRYNSTESRAEYFRLLGEWELNGRRFTVIDQSADGMTVNELIYPIRAAPGGGERAGRDAAGVPARLQALEEPCTATCRPPSSRRRS